MADRLLEGALALVLAAMAIVVAANVFCRFVLGFSLYWGDEAAQSLLVWLTFLGAAIAVREGTHYSLDYFARISTGPLRRFLALLSAGITLLALLGLFVWSLQVARGIYPWILPALRISRVWVYAAGPVGCAFMLLYAARNLVRSLRSGADAPDAPEAV